VINEQKLEFLKYKDETNTDLLSQLIQQKKSEGHNNEQVVLIL
jgi:hypothetical protein